MLRWTPPPLLPLRLPWLDALLLPRDDEEEEDGVVSDSHTIPIPN